MAQIHPQMIGYAGQSTNPAITLSLIEGLVRALWSSLPDMSEQSIQTIFGSFSSDKGVTIAQIGDIPEFNALCNIHPYLTGSLNKADLLRKMYLLNPDRSVHGGIKDFIARINYGEYSTAIVDDDTLWLVTAGKPLYVVDLRGTLGQIFFFPSPAAFRKAIESYATYIPNDCVIIEMPNYQVWRLEHSRENVPNSSFEWRIRKFKVTKTKFYEWGSDGEQHPIYGDN
jgi:hypothetical protein